MQSELDKHLVLRLLSVSQSVSQMIRCAWVCVTVSSGVFLLCRQAKSIGCELKYSMYVMRDARYVSSRVR